MSNIVKQVGSTRACIAIVACPHAPSTQHTVIYETQGEAPKRICQDCFDAIKSDFRDSKLREKPLRSDLSCFQCDSCPSRLNVDLGMGICDACYLRSFKMEMDAQDKRKVPMDILPDEIVPGIFVGPKESAANIATLQALNIKRVLVCCSWIPEYLEKNSSISYLRLAMADSLGQYILPEFVQAAHEFIQEGLDRGEKTLIHCNAGVSRSGAIMVSWIMRSQQLDYDAAVAIVKSKRSLISPNSNFVTQLKSFNFDEIVITSSSGCCSSSDGSDSSTAAAEPSSAALSSSPSSSSSSPTMSKASNLARKTSVFLIGDSTIDNIVWVKNDPKQAVAGHLKQALLAAKGGNSYSNSDGSGSGGVNGDGDGDSNFEIVNLAADGFTSDDVLVGGKPLISQASRSASGEPFPLTPESNGILKPLSILESQASALAEPPIVILSVGGNDIRHTLMEPWNIPQVVPQLIQNLTHIIERIRRVTSRIVIMMQYRPCLNTDEGFYGVYQAIGQLPMPGGGGASLTSVKKVDHLMKQLYTPILQIAKELNIPMIDLPNTFDIRDDSLFECQIEPSNIGGKLIASLMAYVINRHDFSAGGSSRLYSQAPSTTASASSSSTSTATSSSSTAITSKPNEPSTWSVLLP